MKWQTHTSRLAGILDQLSVRDANGNELDQDEGFTHLKNLTLKVRRPGNRIFFIGNGASASMASHFAADIAKNGKIATETFSDLSLLTAIANDISYDHVFAEPLRLKMITGDMLIAISSSGNSPNVLLGAETFKERKGTVVTLSAMREDNSLRKLGSLNFYLPAETYGLAETAHAAVMHFWTDQVIQEVD